MTRTCRECLEELPIEAFYGRGPNKPPHTMCKRCAIYDEFVRREIRKAFPKPESGAFNACGTVSRLEADHDHQLGFINPVSSFRQWVCHSCNEKAKRLEKKAILIS